MTKEILTDEEVKRIVSKSNYWNEVSKRENPTDILYNELSTETKRLGVDKVLKIDTN